MSLKDRMTRQIHTTVSQNELAIINKFVEENGIRSTPELIRIAVNAYIGKEVFRPRIHEPKIKVDELIKKDASARKKIKIHSPPKEPEPFERWKIIGGEVVINTELQRIQIIFTEKPSIETTQILRLNHFVWRPNAGLWQTVLRKSALKKVHELECLKPIEE